MTSLKGLDCDFFLYVNSDIIAQLFYFSTVEASFTCCYYDKEVSLKSRRVIYLIQPVREKQAIILFDLFYLYCNTIYIIKNINELDILNFLLYLLKI